MKYHNLIQDNDSKFNLNPAKKTVVYIDFNNLFHRIYHAANASNNNPVNLMLNSLYALKTNMTHNYMFAIADGKTSSASRLAVYPEYKATRPEKTDEERDEMNFLKQASQDLCHILGITFYETSHIEADDVIGILSKKSCARGWNVIAVSSDKDYKQLCDLPNFNLYNGMKYMVTNHLNMEEQERLSAKQYLDYLTLIGDKADNIKGVYKVGDVTAKKWLNEFGSLTNIMISLHREGLIGRDDVMRMPSMSDKPDEEWFKDLYAVEQPEGYKDPLKDLPKMKDFVGKTNLVAAINSGQLRLNQELIRFQYHHEEHANIPPEIIVKPQINGEALYDFCVKHNLNQFKNKYLREYEPQQNNVQHSNGMRP